MNTLDADFVMWVGPMHEARVRQVIQAAIDAAYQRGYADGCAVSGVIEGSADFVAIPEDRWRYRERGLSATLMQPR